MKEKIIEIVGFNMEPERAELIAQQILDLFAVSGSVFSCFTEGGEIFGQAWLC